MASSISPLHVLYKVIISFLGLSGNISTRPVCCMCSSFAKELVFVSESLELMAFMISGGPRDSKHLHWLVTVVMVVAVAVIVARSSL